MEKATDRVAGMELEKGPSKRQPSRRGEAETQNSTKIARVTPNHEPPSLKITSE